MSLFAAIAAMLLLCGLAVVLASAMLTERRQRRADRGATHEGRRAAGPTA